MRTQLFAGIAIAAITSSAVAEISASTGWEDTSSPAALGTVGNVGASGFTSAPDPVYAGNHSFFMQENPISGTPQAYLGWVTGLSVGDTVTATIWFKGQATGLTGGNAYVKGRLWANYTAEDNINFYDSSAGGMTDYGGDTGEWEMVSHTWTVEDEDLSALVIQSRIYSYGNGDTLYADDLTITVSNDDATITMAGVPAPGAVALLSLAGLARGRRRA